MIIKKLYLEEGFHFREVEFTNHTLIYSKSNSQGKTALIRLILHSLGFNIPSISGMNFFLVTTIITLDLEGEEIILSRNGNNIQYKNGTVLLNFLLPNDTKQLHALIFHIDELNLLDNILGAMYVDQTRGPVVLNRGDIIGNINFNVERFMAGIQGTNIDSLTVSIANEKKNLKDYKSIFTVANYKIENELDYIDVEQANKGNPNNYLQELTLLNSKLKEINKKAKDINSIILENKRFINIIEGYKLYVLDKDGSEIKVDSNNIIGFVDNTMLLKTQLKILEVEKKNIEKDIIKLKQSNESEELFKDIKDYKTIIDEKMRGINIDYNRIVSIINNTENKIKTLKKDLKDKILLNSHVVDYINEIMYKCSEKLGVRKHIEKNGIFTSKVQNKTGAISYKIIICFRIAFIKAVDKYKGIKLPFIIDSLRNTELDEKNAIDILILIDEMIPDHQTIIASVFDYDKYIDSIIEISFPLINNIKSY